MTTKTTTTVPRNQGTFLGATTALVSHKNKRFQGVLFLWERAIEVRGPQTRRVLPRANVRSVQPIGREQAKGLTLHTNDGPWVLQGSDLAHWGHRVESWVSGKISYERSEATWGGGRVTRQTSDSTHAGTLCATDKRLLFFGDDADTPAMELSWSDLTPSSSGLQTAHARFDGPGTDAIVALLSAARAEGTPATGAAIFSTRVLVGWSRAPHMLALRPEGLALVPTSKWGRWWHAPQTISWSDIVAMAAAGPQAIRIDLHDRHIRLENNAIHAVLAELRRIRLAAARVADRTAAAAGRTSAGWVMQYRAARGESWRWAQVRRKGGDIVVESAGSKAIRLPIAAASWWPTAKHPLTLAVSTPDKVLHVRPVAGNRLLPIWTRWLGTPVHAEVEQLPVPPRPASRESRRDIRIPLNLDTWLSPHGAVPDTAFPRATQTIEVSMSSAVVRWTGSLELGQEVGLAVGLGGPPIATRARVARRVCDDLWAVEFISPPGALVHRIGSRVRAQEREDQATARSDDMPLAMPG